MLASQAEWDPQIYCAAEVLTLSLRGITVHACTYCIQGAFNAAMWVKQISERSVSEICFHHPEQLRMLHLYPAYCQKS